MTDLVILTLLLNGPRYGYQLKKDAAIVLGQPPLHNNLVYPLLSKFRKRGWVRRRKAAGRRDQKRQFYRLTAQGRAQTLKQLRMFSEKDAASAPAFQLRVALFSVLDRMARQQVLAAREDALKKKAARARAIATHFKPGKFATAVFDFRRAQMRSELRWIRKLRRLARRC